MKKLVGRLSYANVMATIAVFLALGGAAYALTRNEVKSKHIAPNAAKGADIKESSLVGVSLTKTAVDPAFSEAETLRLATPGYPTANLGCSDNNTPGDFDDDTVSFALQNQTDMTFRLAVSTTRATGEAAIGSTIMLDRPLAPNATQPTTGSGADILQATATLSNPNGQRSLVIQAAAREDNSNHLCSGQIYALRAR